MKQKIKKYGKKALLYFLYILFYSLIMFTSLILSLFINEFFILLTIFPILLTGNKVLELLDKIIKSDAATIFVMYGNLASVLLCIFYILQSNLIIFFNKYIKKNLDDQMIKEEKKDFSSDYKSSRNSYLRKTRCFLIKLNVSIFFFAYLLSCKFGFLLNCFIEKKTSYRKKIDPFLNEVPRPIIFLLEFFFIIALEIILNEIFMVLINRFVNEELKSIDEFFSFIELKALNFIFSDNLPKFINQNVLNLITQIIIVSCIFIYFKQKDRIEFISNEIEEIIEIPLKRQTQI
jgi:hypothetical protein